MTRPSKTSYRIDFGKVFIDPSLRILSYREDYCESSCWAGHGDFEDTRELLRKRIDLEIDKLRKKYTHENCRRYIEKSDAECSQTIAQATTIYWGLEVVDLTASYELFSARRYYKYFYGDSIKTINDVKILDALCWRLAADEWAHTYSKYRFYKSCIYECAIQSNFFKDLDKEFWDSVIIRRFLPDRFAVRSSRVEQDHINSLRELKNQYARLKNKLRFLALGSIGIIISLLILLIG